MQGPPNKWKTSVGNTVAIIQEETTSEIWGNVLSQSSSADLNSRGIEPSTLSTCKPKRKGSQINTGAITLAYNKDQYYYRQSGIQTCTCCISTKTRRIHTKNLQAEQTHQSYCMLQNIQQKQTSEGHQANKHCTHNILTRL